jgi:rhomboid family GlyGly-CTERM serine protease
MRLRVPVLTLFLVGMALLVYAIPSLGDLFVYDRQAILGSEWWRLWTAPLVHFSGSHLGWNLLVFGAAGWAIENARYRKFWLVCGIAAIGPGLLFLLVTPQLAVYGGLSGLATGALAYLCLCEMAKTGKSRPVWLAILLLMGMKILVEAARDEALFVQIAGIPFRVLPLVHAVGVGGAVVAWLYSLYFQRNFQETAGT